MRQRLHIARGLLHWPEVLFLDEPSIGVDPVAARELRRTVADLAAGGTTVLLTTHYMAEADELCDRIAVIAGGTIQALGTPAGSSPRGTGRAAPGGRGVRGCRRRTSTASANCPGCAGWRPRTGAAGRLLTVQSDAGRTLQAQVLAALDGIRLGRVTTREPTLEDAYVAIVEEAEQAEVAGIGTAGGADTGTDGGAGDDPRAATAGRSEEAAV